MALVGRKCKLTKTTFLLAISANAWSSNEQWNKAFRGDHNSRYIRGCEMKSQVVCFRTYALLGDDGFRILSRTLDLVFRCWFGFGFYCTTHAIQKYMRPPGTSSRRFRRPAEASVRCISQPSLPFQCSSWGQGQAAATNKRFCKTYSSLNMQCM